jgi:amino-acid N-acetyltransferase
VSDAVVLRAAGPDDVREIYRLICDNLDAGHLLPRTMADIEGHAHRFIVAIVGEAEERVVGCAELAPLDGRVAEVRSLVVADTFRGRRIGTELVHHIAAAANDRGFESLCAFTHEPAHFVRLGFSIVPHMWVPAKIATDCTSCPLFRRCGQYAVTLTLRAGASVRPQQPAAVIYAGRAAAPRRPHVERLRPVASPRKEAVPA